MTKGNRQDEPWIDVSVPIYDGMVHWPGDPPARLTKELDQEAGDEGTLTRLNMSAHTGTHVDAPVHYIRGGKGVDEWDFVSLTGLARVVEVEDTQVISAETIEELQVQSGERLLLKTKNSERCWRTDEFVPDYTHLSVDAARILAESGIRALGVDYLSVGGGETNTEVHKLLLGAGVCLIEGLNLSAVEPGTYELVCLPLKIKGGDGAPARAILRKR